MKNRFKSSFNIFTLFALLASLLGSAVFATPAYAAGIVVNSNADTIADDGTCTLREAITNANGDSQLYATSGECASGVGTDTITFAANHTITLDGSQLPAVTSTIIINGNGVTNTIIQASSCNPVTLPGSCTPASYRVFEVNSTGNLTLDKITLRHGQCSGQCATNQTIGGGIYNDGTLEISSSTVSGNSSSSDGGGIGSFGTITVTDSTFSTNDALYGGGIGSYGTSTVTRSTFYGNSAVMGGGLYNSGISTMTATNNTVTGNSADIGGGYYNDIASHLAIMNNTISDNSAPYGNNIYNYKGTVTLNNTIVAKSNIFSNCSGVITADAYNLATDNSCGSSNNKTWAEINLGTLTDNDGPTKTMSLLTGSVAIDTGDNSICPTTDQRGTLRPQGGSCDIGAYEADSNSPTFTDVPSTHWAFNYIESLYNAGITSGCSTSPLMYCPDATVTRAQMAIFILRGMHGSAYIPPAATGTVFVDVPANAFAADWIEQLALEGITSGCGNGSYCPNATITRAQMAIFLLRGEHGSIYTPPAATGMVFGDVPLGSFAVNWIEQLAFEGITSGCGGGNYCPDNSVTRAEMAVFLVRAFGLP
ncbi:choice-of-anchor Q domain-containing protein [Candidatus Villigracilis affinis]|uniref:choice-of-anchor Q domain-containing protein n=1 Tax=Candidatus Villigracilis affinis TaxID=3140682 RepID=UPI002A1DDF6A|nr:S-layer homology domain-containing protein [Anaerolineales bacterium]